MINNDLKKMLTLFLNFPSVFFRRRLISVFEILRDQQIDHEMIQYPWQGVSEII